MSEEREVALATLRAVAAQAGLLAMKLERNQLWPGDLQRGVGEIQKLLSDLPEERGR